MIGFLTRHWQRLLQHLAEQDNTTAVEALTWPGLKPWVALQAWFCYTIMEEESCIKMSDWRRGKQRTIRLAPLLRIGEKYLDDLKKFEVTPAKFPDDEAHETEVRRYGRGHLYKMIGR